LEPEEIQKAFGLMNKDWREDWGKAIQSIKKSGYNIINHKNFNYDDPENYLTYTDHYWKHNIDYPNDHIDKKYKNQEFLNEYHFKDSYKSSPHKTIEEKILYKTKDLPDTIKGLFKDSKLL